MALPISSTFVHIMSCLCYDTNYTPAGQVSITASIQAMRRNASIVWLGKYRMEKDERRRRNHSQLL